MLASTIQFTTNPPTPTPTPPTNREAEKAGQATRAHCPRTPTACHPQHARTPTTTKPGSSGRVSYASTRQPTPPQHPPHRQDTRAPASHPAFRGQQPPGRPGPNYTAQTRSNDQEATPTQPILRKEVIQPHLPVRLPCYDFTPVMSPTVVSALLAVKLPTSGKTHSHGVTGGVYKTRERIHRGMLIRDY